MTELTKAQLIKEAKLKIAVAKFYPNSEMARVEGELFKIALASLEAEPVAWLYSDNGLGIPAITRSKNIADSWLSNGWYVQPLYIA
ncbi:valyl-tRNA synthetase, partial [Escherichia coli]